MPSMQRRFVSRGFIRYPYSTNPAKVLFAVILVLSLAACSAVPPPVTAPVSPTNASLANPVQLKIYAPSALTEASKELGAAFESRSPGVKVVFEMGHSPTQRLQMEQGAKADVFVSASEKDMKDALASKLVAEGSSAVFATNQLILILPAGNPANIKSVEDLARPGVKALLAAEDVPAGKVTRDMLDRLEAARAGQGLKSKILANVISNEPGVKPIVAKIKLGEADAGIVYISDAAAAPDLKTVTIPPDINVVAKFTIAPLSMSAYPEQAKAFSTFVLSAEGQSILKKMGFQPGIPQ